MITTRNARLDVFKPTNDSSEPDFSISGPDIVNVDISERVQDLADDATIVLNNAEGKHTDKITSGDKVQLYIERSDGGGVSYNAGLYGEGLYGSAQLLAWTGMVRGITYQKFDPINGEITLECQDFVGAVLSFRTVYNAFEQRQIAGAPDAIVNRLLQTKAPEVGRGRIEEVTQLTDLFVNGKVLYDVIGDLAREANCMLASRDTELVFRPVTALESEFVLTEADMKGPRTLQLNDESLVNDVRVNGGTDKEIEVANENVDDYVTVSEETLILTKIRTRKSRLHTVDVWTRPTGSGESVVVRLQSDQDGQPVDIGNQNSDLVRAQLEEDELTDDGFTSFVLPDHVLPEPNSWLIIEGDGSEGQEIGINSVGSTPGFRTYYPFPVSVQLPDRASQNEYRWREGERNNDSLVTFEAARGVGEATLDRNKLPRRGFEFHARTERAYRLKPLDVVTLDVPGLESGRDYVIIEKTTTYNNSRMDVTLTAQELDSI